VLAPAVVCADILDRVLEGWALVKRKIEWIKDDEG
jgi:hypothetical protein